MTRHAQASILLGTLLLAAAAVAAGARAEPAESAFADPPVRVVADLSTRRLSILQGTDVIESYPVAIGKGSKPTPTGSYTIRKIVWNPAWVPPDSKWAQGKKPQPPGAKDNPMKLVKIFFREPDYYIHGTSAVETLGEEASHGCLLMDPDDAYAVARFLMEHGGEPRDESWFWRVLHFRSETRTVYLSNPVAIAVTD